MQVSLIFMIFQRTFENLIFFKSIEITYLKRFWDDLEARIGISIQK